MQPRCASEKIDDCKENSEIREGRFSQSACEEGQERVWIAQPYQKCIEQEAGCKSDQAGVCIRDQIEACDEEVGAQEIIRGGCREESCNEIIYRPVEAQAGRQALGEEADQITGFRIQAFKTRIAGQDDPACVDARSCGP
jgi:hypothetical protein